MKCLHPNPNPNICTLTVFASSSESFWGYFFVVVNLLNFIKLPAFDIKVLAACQSCHATVRR